MRLYPHVISETAALTAADTVISAIAIPGNSDLKHVWMDVSMVATVAISVLQAALYGLTAYILPLTDPDAGATPDTMWDLLVPKDDTLGSDVIDMDRVTTADATPEIEPGEPSLEECSTSVADPSAYSNVLK